MKGRTQPVAGEDKPKKPLIDIEELNKAEPEDGVFVVPRGWARRVAAKKRQKAVPSSDHPEWPKTVEEAERQILSEMSEQDKQTLLEMPRENLPMLHFGWGMGIRNGLGLWGPNQALLRDCSKGHPWVDADSASWVIMEAVWDALHDPSRAEGTQGGGPEGDA